MKTNSKNKNYLNDRDNEIVMIIPTTEQIIKLLIAIALGGIVGLEREKMHKPAGLRTHILVCIGAALATIVSVDYFGADPARIAAAIMTGIGFVGAGAIIASGKDVHGLTTAASIWTIAAIGIAIGVGYYILASIAAVLVLVVLVFGKIEKVVVKKK